MWEVINRSLHKKSKTTKPHIKSIKNSSNIYITDDAIMANGFNKYFVNIGKIWLIKSPMFQISFLVPEWPTLQHLQKPLAASCCEVVDIIKVLKSKKCIFSTDIPLRFIKLIALDIAPVLAIFFNCCLRKGVYESDSNPQSRS